LPNSSNISLSKPVTTREHGSEQQMLHYVSLVLFYPAGYLHNGIDKRRLSRFHFPSRGIY
jgi:hypothetical protein